MTYGLYLSLEDRIQKIFNLKIHFSKIQWVAAANGNSIKFIKSLEFNFNTTKILNLSLKTMDLAVSHELQVAT